MGSHLLNNEMLKGGGETRGEQREEGRERRGNKGGRGEEERMFLLASNKSHSCVKSDGCFQLSIHIYIHLFITAVKIHILHALIM